MVTGCTPARTVALRRTTAPTTSESSVTGPRPPYDDPYREPRPVTRQLPPSQHPAVRLWAGGVATALVTALAAAVAVLVERAFDVTPTTPGWVVSLGSDADVTARYAITGAIAALLATGLLHLLLLTTPRPSIFFQSIVFLVTVAAATDAITGNGDLKSRAAAAAVAVVIGLAIALPLNSVSHQWPARQAGGW